MPVAEAIRPKNHLARRVIQITADANGNLPDRIELIVSRAWSSESHKGQLNITPQDLEEFKANFEAKIGTPGRSGQLAIDFKHESQDIAGCWIHAMEIVDGKLYGTQLEWTPTGKSLISGGEFKFFSPSFYPGCLGEWCDPEDWTITARNVIVGGAFTNIPWMKGLQPVRASETQEGNKEDTLYIDADAKGAKMRTLDEVRVMAAADLTDEDKTLLDQNKAKLSADERKKFGLEDAKLPVDSDESIKISADEQQVLADIKSGKKVLVDASEHNELKTTVSDLKTKVEAQQKTLESDAEAKIRTRVEACAAQGKIVADQVDKWVDRAKTDASVLDDIEKMQSNPILAAENGKDQQNKEITASAELDEKIEKLMADEKISYSAAVIKVANQNPDAVKARDAELAGAGK
jgi:hypothetical protein